MEVYKITYKNLEQQDEFEGVYAISLVEDPANEMQFIMLSNTKKDVLKLANKEKQLLTGVVLMPNQKIYRRDDSGKEYEIFFEADVIEKLSQDFLKNGFQKNSTYNHNENNWLQDISVVEQWIIEDPENDKANALGFKELPKGTWMVTFKVSDEVWGDYVKTGKVKGFSIDAFLDMEKIKMNNNKTKKRKKMSLLTKLRNLIATTLMKEIEIEGMGKLLSENFEIGDEVFSGNELVKSSSFTYEGFVYMTDEDGVIVSKDEFVEDMPAEEAEMESEEKEDDVQMEEVTEEEVIEIVDIAESIAEEVVEGEGEVNVEVLQEMVSFLEEKVDALEVENADLKSQLSKKPNTQKLSAVSNVSNISESKIKGKASILNAVLKNK